MRKEFADFSAINSSYKDLIIKTLKIINCIFLHILSLYLSSTAGCSAGVSGCTQRAWLIKIIRQTKFQAAIVRKELKGLPGLSKVSRTFDSHGSRPRWPEHQNNMGQTELCFQVQPDLILQLLRGSTWTRCPPGIRMHERVVSHVSWRVGVLGTEVGGHRRMEARACVRGAVPTAAREGEEGPATRQVPYGGTTGMVHTSGNWCRGWCWRKYRYSDHCFLQFYC